MARLFISYARDDKQPDAFHLAEQLQAFGFDAWIDRSDLPTGRDWHTQLAQAIESCEVVIFILTPGSTESNWVQREIQVAEERRKPILSVVMRPMRPPPELRHYETFDLSNHNPQGFSFLKDKLNWLCDSHTQIRRNQFLNFLDNDIADETSPFESYLRDQWLGHLINRYLHYNQISRHQFIHSLTLDPELAESILEGEGIVTMEDMDDQLLLEIEAAAGMARGAILAEWEARNYLTEWNSPEDDLAQQKTRSIFQTATPTDTPTPTPTLTIHNHIKPADFLHSELVQFGMDWLRIKYKQDALTDPQSAQNLNIEWYRLRLLHPNSDGKQDGNLRTDRKAIYISKSPITYAQYEAFLRASDGYTALMWGQGKQAIEQMDLFDRLTINKQHPVKHVSWYEAIAFCEWLSHRLEQNIDLLSEDEWECLVIDGDQRDLQHIRSGDSHSISETLDDETPPEKLNNPYGISDMAGNVWEWCSPRSLGHADKQKIIRRKTDTPIPDRLAVDASTRRDDLGFRICVREPLAS